MEEARFIKKACMTSPTCCLLPKKASRMEKLPRTLDLGMAYDESSVDTKVIRLEEFSLCKFTRDTLEEDFEFVLFQLKYSYSKTDLTSCLI